MSLFNDPGIWFRDIFVDAGLSFGLSSLLSTIALVLIVILLSWLANLTAKAIILQVVTRIVKRTTNTWDDIFLEQKVFTRLSHFAPALVIWFMAAWALKAYPTWLAVVHKMTYIYMVIIGTVVLNSFIDAWHEVYKTLPIARHRHIKGYVQLVKIFVIVVTILILISVLFKKDISTIVAGIGAITAVLILVFRDTLLGLVASIQLSADKMLKVGDWISIPRRDIDGVVDDITLNTVKVRNFDKSIITIPTYSLVNDSFQNWRGMEESGIRQLKRSIFIDMKSIRFLDKEMKDRLCKVPELNEFIKSGEAKKDMTHKDFKDSDSPFFNYSQITNLGVFRFYAESYLKKCQDVDISQTILIKHKQIEGNGLPLQIYLFTKNNQFVPYENLQSEIVEHFLAILSEFGLKVFQQPTGDDLQPILNKGNN
jgi:miniconductance mechanosensitive channel